MPVRSWSAKSKADPSAREQSSAVWWSSTTKSPLQCNVKSKWPCLASAWNMWSKKPGQTGSETLFELIRKLRTKDIICSKLFLPIPVLTSIFSPVPSKFNSHLIWVSFVFLSTTADRSLLPSIFSEFSSAVLIFFKLVFSVVFCSSVNFCTSCARSSSLSLRRLSISAMFTKWGVSMSLKIVIE